MTVQREHGEQVDVLIVTAVKDEWDAVLAVDTGANPGSPWKARPGAAGPEVFYRTFTTDAGALRIGVVQAFGMGREQAVGAAAPLLERHPEIRCLAMCGVCAGRRGDVALGDVIIADKTWPYDAGKLQATVNEQGHRSERFQGDMDLYRIHPAEWKQRAERFQIDPTTPWIKERPRSYEEQGDWVLECLAKNKDPTHPNHKIKCPDWTAVLKQLWKAKRLEDGELKLTDIGRKHISRRLMLEIDGLHDPAPFKIVVGPIASGAPVVQDPTIFEHLSDTQAMRKVIGLEMETSAILGLAYLRKVPYAVVMKGVMDHADVFKSDNMKPFAAKASAECLIAFVRQNLRDPSASATQPSSPYSRAVRPYAGRDETDPGRATFKDASSSHPPLTHSDGADITSSQARALPAALLDLIEELGFPTISADSTGLIFRKSTAAPTALFHSLRSRLDTPKSNDVLVISAHNVDEITTVDRIDSDHECEALGGVTRTPGGSGANTAYFLGIHPTVTIWLG